MMRFFLSEIRRKVRHQWTWAAFLLFCVLLFCPENTEAGYNLSLGDRFCTLFLGMTSFIRGVTPVFSIPVSWLLMILACLLPSADLVSGDLEKTGRMNILLLGSRRKWCVSRYLLSTFYSCFTFSLILIFCYGMTWIEHGDLRLKTTVYLLDTAGIAVGSDASKTILLTLLCLITSSIILVALDFVWNSLIAFFIVICVEVLSCYLTTPLLVGNGAMVLRGPCGEDALPVSLYIAICLFEAAVCLCFSYLYFSGKDLIRRRHED